MSNEQKYTTLMVRVLSGNASPTERQVFDEWLQASAENRRAYTQTKKIWQHVKDDVTIPAPNRVKAWNNIAKSIEPVPQHPVRRNRAHKSAVRRWSIAATILLLVSVAVWQFLLPSDVENMATVETVSTTQAKKEVSLPDGSVVRLNKGSELRYSKPFTPRKVTLKGEAFFEVTHNPAAPFTIEAAGTQVRVLGTSFNVRAYDTEAEVAVTVATGKVAFSPTKTPTKAPAILMPGASAVFDKKAKTISKTNQKDQNYNAWMTGNLSFPETPLKEVTAQLERYFGTELKLENAALENCLFVGKFQEPTLDEVMKSLAFTLDVEVKKENGYWLVSGDGCQ